MSYRLIVKDENTESCIYFNMPEVFRLRDMLDDQLRRDIDAERIRKVDIPKIK